ncbi:creatininase family protein [Mariniluteicoccus flavus]
MGYAELTSPEAGELQQAGAVLVLPVGSLEQHGPALPLSTDTIRAESVAERLADRFGDSELLVLPALPYGVSPHHARLPGTLTLSPQLFCELIIELCCSMADTGWRKLFVINGHGGNQAALSLAQQEMMSRRPEFLFAWSPVTGLAKNSIGSLDTTEVTGHSGEAETAQMLALRPDLVRTDRLAPGATTLASLDAAPRLSRTSPPSLAVTFDRYHPSGVLGDPTTATRDQGEAILSEVVDTLSGYLRSFRAL